MTTTTMPISATPRSDAAPLVVTPAAPPAAASLLVEAVPADPFLEARYRFTQLIAVSAVAFAATCAAVVLAPSFPWAA